MFNSHFTARLDAYLTQSDDDAVHCIHCGIVVPQISHVCVDMCGDCFYAHLDEDIADPRTDVSDQLDDEDMANWDADTDQDHDSRNYFPYTGDCTWIDSIPF